MGREKGCFLSLLTFMFEAIAAEEATFLKERGLFCDIGTGPSGQEPCLVMVTFPWAEAEAVPSSSYCS